MQADTKQGTQTLVQCAHHSQTHTHTHTLSLSLSLVTSHAPTSTSGRSSTVCVARVFAGITTYTTTSTPTRVIAITHLLVGRIVAQPLRAKRQRERARLRLSLVAAIHRCDVGACDRRSDDGARAITLTWRNVERRSALQLKLVGSQLCVAHAQFDTSHRPSRTGICAGASAPVSSNQAA
jgi:hypothetical protein